MICWLKRSLPVACLVAVFLCSCSADAPAPTFSPAPTFEPAPAVEVQNAKIAVSSVWGDGAFDSMEKRLNEALAAAGQHVEFDVQAVQYVDGKDSDDVYMDKVRAELAEGKPSADAYCLNFVNSGALFDANLLMDMTELIPRHAPVFYSKYKDLFPEKLTGIPSGIMSKPVWSKAVLVLRNDFVPAGGGICTVEALFAFIDETIIKAGKPYCMLAYEPDLVLAWALERGYYSLDMFGVNGLLFCRIDDATFTPVPMEDIPGFAQFMAAMKELRKKKALRYPFDPLEGAECIGYVYDISYFYVTSPYLNIPLANGDFTAQLLSPELPGYFTEPVYAFELAVPALCNSDKAAQTVRFVEWLYAGQGNYDTVIYGAEGEDFRQSGGRYTPLSAGKPLQGEGYEQLEALFFAWPGAQELFNFDYFRLPASAPGRVEELAADGIAQNRRFPLGERIRKERKTVDAFLKLGGEFAAASLARNEMAYALIQMDPATFTGESLDSAIAKLRKLNNKWLCEQYKAIINGLVNRPK